MPPNRRLVVPSACWNASKMRRTLSAGMPMPVSMTEKATTRSAWARMSPAKRMPCSAWPTWSVTEPSSVNLTAFESRFLRICWSRCGSVWIRGTAFGAKSSSNASSFSSAIGANVRSSADSSSAIWISATVMSIFPASTLERSRMSLIRSSRSEPAVWIVRANSICRSVRLPSGLSPSSFARMRRELSGVRSSCDMLARNSDL